MKPSASCVVCLVSSLCLQPDTALKIHLHLALFFPRNVEYHTEVPETIPSSTRKPNYSVIRGKRSSMHCSLLKEIMMALSIEPNYKFKMPFIN